jgi:hypothetical protein
VMANLTHLARRGRLAIAREGIGLADEVAASPSVLRATVPFYFRFPTDTRFLSSPICLLVATGSPTPSKAASTIDVPRVHATDGEMIETSDVKTFPRHVL